MPSASHKHVCGGSGVMHGKPIGVHNLAFRNWENVSIIDEEVIRATTARI